MFLVAEFYLPNTAGFVVIATVLPRGLDALTPHTHTHTRTRTRRLAAPAGAGLGRPPPPRVCLPSHWLPWLP